MKSFLYLVVFLFAIGVSPIYSQIITGNISDESDSEPLIAATVLVEGTTSGATTDFDGEFEIKWTGDFPVTLIVSYIGYTTKKYIADSAKNNKITLESNALTIDAVVVKSDRISDELKSSALTIEALDNIAIKQSAAPDFYASLGNLKGVDLTTASLGFKIVNTRGFNSTSPVRSLQIIDGVDNQAPGLNFSLGNFLGTSELDINKVEIIVGASSAFYGPNAFNGVISMETKDPFFHTGLSAMVKTGEQNLVKTAVRWADAFKNKDGHSNFAYKLNLEYLKADDWVADNYDPVDGSPVSKDNPGGFDAVNIYGDEYQSGNDFTDFPLYTNTGLGNWYRTGYKESDLVDYDTENYKANASFHFKTNPSKGFESPELIFTSSYGGGTTVYQGDNRFSLKGITFFQNKLEYRKRDKFFIRAFTTTTTAGDSYDPYFTALRLIENGKGDREWSADYLDYWLKNIIPQIEDSDFPKLETIIDPTTGMVSFKFDVEAAEQWMLDNNMDLSDWHKETREFADGPGTGSDISNGFYQPGTAAFDEEFNRITTTLRSEGGTKFYDESSLYHIHGEYKFNPTWVEEITIGANARRYTPRSRGTIFSDRDSAIVNNEVGVYGGFSKFIIKDQLKLNGALRVDKNQNFQTLASPALSLVYTPTEKDFFRISFSSAIRNPTLSDQYLDMDVGRAILAGNLNGAKDLVTIPSLRQYFSTRQASDLDSFDISPIQPEEVKTIEIGARTTLFNKVYIDAGYYYSIYDNFIGFQVGADADIDFQLGALRDLQIFRYAANSENTVTSQGVAIGIYYYLSSKYTISGNYSWNKLNTEFEDDPIIPAFNTPEHKFNIGISGRDFSLFGLHHLGATINYKWIEGFIFEGSPQFSGFIPSYDMLDAQINMEVPKINTTFKLGASNLLNNESFQTFGGPRIGRLVYFQITYEMNTKN